MYLYWHTILCDRLFGIVVSTSDCHQRDPWFDSRLYPRNFSEGIGSVSRSTHPCEDKWITIRLKSGEIRLRNLKLGLRDNTSLARPPALLSECKSQVAWSLVSDSWKLLETPNSYHPSFDCIVAKR